MDLREGIPADPISAVDFPFPHAKMIPNNHPRHAIALFLCWSECFIDLKSFCNERNVFSCMVFKDGDCLCTTCQTGLADIWSLSGKTGAVLLKRMSDLR